MPSTEYNHRQHIPATGFPASLSPFGRPLAHIHVGTSIKMYLICNQHWIILYVNYKQLLYNYIRQFNSNKTRKDEKSTTKYTTKKASSDEKLYIIFRNSFVYLCCSHITYCHSTFSVAGSGMGLACSGVIARSVANICLPTLQQTIILKRYIFPSANCLVLTASYLERWNSIRKLSPRSCQLVSGWC